MATIKFIYRDQKERGGEAPLYLRIYHNGKKRLKKTNLYLKQKYWDEDNQRIRKSHPESTKVQLDLDGWKARAHEAVRKADPMTAANIKNIIEGKNSQSYFVYADKVVPSLSYSYQKIIKAAHKHFKKYSPDVTLTGIDVSLLRGFEKKLLETVSQNTASEYLGVIRRILNRAINDEIIKPGDSPFVSKKISLKHENTDPTPLKWDQFVKVRDYDAGENLKLYQDMFLFAVFMDGMRLTDVLTFRPGCIKDGKARYQMSKTKKQKVIKIVPAANKIISRYQEGTYLFPLLDPSMKGNDRRDEIRRLTGQIWGKLKTLGERADLDVHLHFHMARNTSAYIAYEKGNWSIVEIQNMLSHSSIQQTRDYLGKMAPEEIDDKRDALWD